MDFFREFWGNKGYDRVIPKPDGVFIVKFHTILGRDKVNKEDLGRILVWETFPELDFRYWRGAEQGSQFIRLPLGYRYKTCTKFAGELTKMNICQCFPTKVTSIDEYGTLTVKAVEFARKPLKCSHCSMFVHTIDTCKRKYRYEWRIKANDQMPQ
ncbi:LOW QUALITY PROTEIN: hypothetical protein Cgig2_013790 [Carnegiea gigantea]|uniref:Uncharacterized protein n=1 Tax=Carnegiea gigantea TaxID=171969 RepID=A0A9Q1Q5F7_9CARY|nr:LOW QUALITY PROTEIN: hypothetical protein Cgig2_013790 [Carnegiea gigantea]